MPSAPVQSLMCTRALHALHRSNHRAWHACHCYCYLQCMQIPPAILNFKLLTSMPAASSALQNQVRLVNDAQSLWALMRHSICAWRKKRVWM